MDNDIILKVREEVIKRNNSDSNFYGKDVYEDHIKSVVDNAIFLADKYNADAEIVEIAALLHDIASITDKNLYEEHHIHGANIAVEILNELNYPSDKTEKVKKCILNHRGSVLKDKISIEEICIADADAISHFFNVPSLFNLAYKIIGLDRVKGEEFVKNKLNRSYNKLSENSKIIFKDKYNNTISIFNK